MDVPNFKALAEEIFALGDYDLSQKADCGAFVRAFAVAVFARDPRFRMLKKRPPQNRVADPRGREHAVDAVLFVEHPTKAIAVDIIGSSATPKAKPAWTLDKDSKTKQPKYRYTEADGFVPDYGGAPVPSDPPVPAPPPLPPPPARPRLGYAEWLQASTIITTELDRHRGGHSPTDVAHFLYGRVEEGRTLADITKEIRGI